jgi:hypothetical protein
MRAWLGLVLATFWTLPSMAFAGPLQEPAADSRPVLSGSEVLDRLGTGRAFCVLHLTEPNSCRWTRSVVQRSATQVVLDEIQGERTDRCSGRYFCDPDALERAKVAGYDGIILTRRYTFDVGPTGLCQSKQQALDDALRAQVWYARVDRSDNVGASPVSMPEAEQRFFRDRLIFSLQGELDGQRCRVFREAFAHWQAEGDPLTEEMYVDGYPLNNRIIFRSVRFIDEADSISYLRFPDR